jgi:hypothetical protein
MSSNDEQVQIVQTIMQLRIDHKDLDDSIYALSQSNYVDHLQLKRMKKRKLSLKDSIKRLESQLIPDKDA